jgi:hypothetical protein
MIVVADSSPLRYLIVFGPGVNFRAAGGPGWSS